MSRKVIDPATGEVRELPAAEAEAGFRSGRYHLAPGTEVPIADAGGNFRAYYKAEHIPALLREAGDSVRFADDDAILRHDAEQQPVRAFAEAFANDALIPGAYDMAAQAAGLDMKEIAARRETAAATAGQVTAFGAGLLGPALAGRAAGTAGRLAQNLIPGAALETAARAATEVAEKHVTDMVRNEATQYALAAGLGNAAVGGAVGAAVALDEAALGNAEASVETILTGVGAGALIGGVLGGGLGRVFGKAATAADGRTTVGGKEGAALADEVGPQLSAVELAAALEAAGQEVHQVGNERWFPRLMAKLSSKATGANEEDILRVMSPAGQRIILEGERARDEAVRAFATLGDQLEAVAQRTDIDEARVSDAVLSAIPADRGDMAIQTVHDSLYEAKAGLNNLIKEATNYGKTSDQVASMLKPIRERLEQAERRIIGDIEGDSVLGKVVKMSEADEVAAAKRGIAKAKELKDAKRVKLGAGFARTVYDDGDEAVIKTAKNKEGIQQNRAEAELSARSDVLNPVVDHAPDYSWVRQEKVETFDPGLFGQAPTEAKLAGPVGRANKLPRHVDETGREWLDRVKVSDFLADTKLNEVQFGKLVQAGKLKVDGDLIVVPKKPRINTTSAKGFQPEGPMAEYLGIPDQEGWLRRLVDGTYSGPRTPKLDEFEERLFRVMKEVPELDPSDLGKASQWGLNQKGDIVLIDYGDRLKDALQGAATKAGVTGVSPKVAKAAFRELDQVWRVVAAQERKLKSIIGETEGLSKVSQTLRSRLQDEDVWGEAGHAHRELTERSEAMHKAREDLTRHIPIRDGKMDRAALNSFSRKIDRVTGDETVGALARWVDAHNALAASATKHLDGEGWWRGKQRANLVREYKDVYERLSRDVMTMNAQDRLLAQSRMQGFVPTALLHGALTGAGLPHAMAVPVTAMGNMILNPGRSARQIAAFAAFKRNVAEHLGGRLRKLVGDDAVIPRLAIETQAPKAVRLLMEGTPAERREAYEEQIEALQAASDPETYVNNVAQATAPIVDSMPEHAAQMSVQGQRIMSYLMQTAPKPITASNPSVADYIGMIKDAKRKAPKGKHAPKDEDLREWGQIHDVAYRGPTAIIERMEKNNLRVIHVRALDNMFPHQAQEMRRVMMDALPTAKNPKVNRSVELFLQGGESTTPAGRRVFQQSIYAQEAARNAEAAAAVEPPPVQVIGPLSTPTDRTQTFPFPSR